MQYFMNFQRGRIFLSSLQNAAYQLNWHSASTFKKFSDRKQAVEKEKDNGTTDWYLRSKEGLGADA
jgi:hypothetical protein